MTKIVDTPSDPKDVNAYREINDFEKLIDPRASSFRSMVEDVADDFEEDFDIDQATQDYVAAISQATEPYGYTVTPSGVASWYPYKGYDFEGAIEAAKEVDLMEILQKHSR